jgi:ATP-dependent DNA helicase Q4
MRCSKIGQIEESDKLKEIIRNYFERKITPDIIISDKLEDSASNQQIESDIIQMIQIYPENNFSGRSLARIFHGISSPCYPAVIWGRCKYWRSHLSEDFHRLVHIGNKAIIKMKTGF